MMVQVGEEVSHNLEERTEMTESAGAGFSQEHAGNYGWSRLWWSS